MADPQDMNEASSHRAESPSINAGEMRQVMHGHESTSRISVGGHETSITRSHSRKGRSLQRHYQ